MFVILLVLGPLVVLVRRYLVNIFYSERHILPECLTYHPFGFTGEPGVNVLRPNQRSMRRRADQEYLDGYTSMYRGQRRRRSTHLERGL